MTIMTNVHWTTVGELREGDTVHFEGSMFVVKYIVKHMPQIPYTPEHGHVGLLLETPTPESLRIYVAVPERTDISRYA